MDWLRKHLSTESKRPVLLLELGNLQVYTHQTKHEVKTKTVPTRIFWQDKKSGSSYGPFDSIFEATKHYTWIVESQKSEPTQSASIIYVDFVKKNRIDYK